MPISVPSAQIACADQNRFAWWSQSGMLLLIQMPTVQRFYHVLGGIISPLDGVGPDQLTIEALVNRVIKEKTEEVIFALNPTIQGDTTIYYIQKKLQSTGVRITTIARGIAFGGELEYADELTLGRSLQNRMPVESYVSHR